MDLSSFKKLILDLLFPKFCINCGKEESYLCQDCFSLVDIAERQYCPFCSSPKVVIDGKTCNYCKKSKQLSGLYCATSYNNFIAKKMINQFKYEPSSEAPQAPTLSIKLWGRILFKFTMKLAIFQVDLINFNR